MLATSVGGRGPGLASVLPGAGLWRGGLRDDLRARADRAEADADARRAELARARADSEPAPAAGGDAGSTWRPRRRTGGQEDQQA